MLALSQGAPGQQQAFRAGDALVYPDHTAQKNTNEMLNVVPEPEPAKIWHRRCEAGKPGSPVSTFDPVSAHILDLCRHEA